MDVDEQLEDAFEAAFAEDEAAVGEEGPAADDGVAGPDTQEAHDDLDEDDYDDHEAPARGEPTRQAEGDGLMQAFSLLRDGPDGRAADTAAAARADTGPSPDEIAAYKKEVFDSLTEEQKNRYEVFMRASLPKPKMKKLMQAILQNTAPADKAVIAMCGIAKLFVGELVENARVAAAQEGHTGPLLPRHIRLAHAKLAAEGKLPTRAGSPALFGGRRAPFR